MVKLKIGAIVAILDDDLEWSVSFTDGIEPPHRKGGRMAATVKRMLETLTEIEMNNGLYAAWPQLRVAEVITSALGGEILEVRDERTASAPRVIY